MGRYRHAYYNIEDLWFTQKVMVGTVETSCFGRCGYGCGRRWKTTYTQECLDHDLCHRETGENLGICTPYFLKAMSGFLFAPSCH